MGIPGIETRTGLLTPEENLTLDGFVENGTISSRHYSNAISMKSQRVLVKLCPVACANISARVDLLVEARLLLALSRHPNILSLLGVVATEEPVAIITEIMANGTLSNFLSQHSNNRDLSLYEQITICNQVASAMSYMESLAIVHRALNINTVMVGIGVTDIKLAEFGKLFGYCWDFSNHCHCRPSSRRL